MAHNPIMDDEFDIIKHGSINKIIALAKEKKVIINEISKAKLKQMAQTENDHSCSYST